MSDWLERHAKRLPGLRKNELDELRRSNRYPVERGDLKDFNRAHIPEVRTFISDISRISHKPNMSELVSLVVGEVGKGLTHAYKLTSDYKAMYGDEWEARARQNESWGDRTHIVKVLALYAQANNHSADDVWREYHMRTENLAKNR
jgi:hypothetical protein